jgi:hypothetical protein
MFKFLHTYRVKLGVGQITEDSTEADFALIASTESRKKYPGKTLTWSQFFDLMQPPDKFVNTEGNDAT